MRRAMPQRATASPSFSDPSTAAATTPTTIPDDHLAIHYARTLIELGEYAHAAAVLSETSLTDKAASSVPPPILRTEDGPVHHVFTCSLCCEIPLQPVITPCHHVFCRPCIVQALESRSECPNDRHPLDFCDLQEIDGALRRIWEHIPVRCPECSSWTGTVGNYVAHVRRCMEVAFESAQDFERHLQELEERHEVEIQELVEMHDNEMQELRVRCDQDLQQRIDRLRTTNEHDKNEAIAVVHHQCQKELDGQVEKLQGKLGGHQCATCKPLDTDYHYDRSRIVELTQLICRNLEDMPSNVDRNRIFRCIWHSHDDFKRGRKDNPAHYLVDFRMLLNVCRASTWFSDKQLASINKWCADQNW